MKSFDANEQPVNEAVWCATEASVITGGESSRYWRAGGISMNINDIRPGDLFVASGRDDLDEVFKKGAAAVMIERGMDGHPHLPVLKVAGTYGALQSLAQAARFRTHATVIAVQGKEARAFVQRVLSGAGQVHCGGRHLSLGLAGLPSDADYGVFGFSPAVRPDIAIVTDTASASRDDMFEMMPSSGSVIVNAQGEGFLSVMARAKAAGIENIYSYGAGEACDARVLDVLAAANGVRVRVALMGQEISFHMPPGFVLDNDLPAALLALRLSDRCVVSVMRVFGRTFAQLKNDQDVMLIDPAAARAQEAVFRITNMIDLGAGGQTAILDNISKTACNTLHFSKNPAIPARLANLNFVYTSKGIGTVANAKAIISERHKGSRIESIATDALAPGDFLVFKDIWDSSKSALSDALRIIPERGKRPSNAV